MVNRSFAAHTTPQEIALAGDGTVLRVMLGTGEQVAFEADKLRAACRCAHCRRARIDGVFPAAFERVTIRRFAPMGRYAINIVFSDGHERGIFPWSYLSELAAEVRGN
jgi:DUF971 family protein